MKRAWMIAGLCSAIAMSVMVFAASSLASPNDPADGGQVRNPHWKTDGCSQCHGQGEPTDINHDEVTSLCTRCHDGVHAPEEVHPVGRSFSGDQVVLPSGWPAPGGKLSCITCHDVLMACDRDRTRPEVNAAFLRDYAGGGQLEHCARCHVAAAQTKGKRYSPHKMLDDSGRPIAEACAFCHTPELNAQTAAKRLDRQGRPALRADGLSLCVGCHRRHQDYFSPGHIGLKVSNHFSDRMEQRRPPLADGAGHASTTQPAWSGKDLLPLEGGSRIVCATCHNPHQQGLFPASGVLGAGAMSPSVAAQDSAASVTNRNDRLRRRGLGSHVCLGCHKK